MRLRLSWALRLGRRALLAMASPCCSGYITGVVLPVTGSVDAI